MIDTAGFIDSLQNNQLKSLAFYLIPIGACIVASVSAMGSFGGLRYAMSFSLFFALMIAFYSGTLTGLPERVIRMLGLGGYTAQVIQLDEDFCKGGSSHLPVSQDCVLTDARVVWSMGDTLTLLIGEAKEARQVQIPSHFVKAIVRQPG